MQLCFLPRVHWIHRTKENPHWLWWPAGNSFLELQAVAGGFVPHAFVFSWNLSCREELENTQAYQQLMAKHCCSCVGKKCKQNLSNHKRKTDWCTSFTAAGNERTGERTDTLHGDLDGRARDTRQKSWIGLRKLKRNKHSRWWLAKHQTHWWFPRMIRFCLCLKYENVKVSMKPGRSSKIMTAQLIAATLEKCGCLSRPPFGCSFSSPVT